MVGPSSLVEAVPSSSRVVVAYFEDIVANFEDIAAIFEVVVIYFEAISNV